MATTEVEPAAAPRVEASLAPASPSASAPAARSHFSGDPGGGPLKVTSAVFHWRPLADDMQLVFADVPNLCNFLRAGAWPRGARLLMLSLKQNEDRDGLFSAGDYPIRSAKARASRDTKRATLMELGADCRPVARVAAQSGSVQLDGPTVSDRAPVRGKLELDFAGGSLKGSFEATYCPQSETEPQGCE